MAIQRRRTQSRRSAAQCCVRRADRVSCVMLFRLGRQIGVRLAQVLAVAVVVASGIVVAAIGAVDGACSHLSRLARSGRVIDEMIIAAGPIERLLQLTTRQLNRRRRPIHWVADYLLHRIAATGLQLVSSVTSSRLSACISAHLISSDEPITGMEALCLAARTILTAAIIITAKVVLPVAAAKVLRC